MAIFRQWLGWLGIRGMVAARASDAALDWYIADALADDARAPVPPGAWERLRQAAGDRRPVQGYGMWILDEAQCDPPVRSPATLTDAEMKRALRIYNRRRRVPRWLVGHPSLSGLSPTFVAVLSV